MRRLISAFLVTLLAALAACGSPEPILESMGQVRGQVQVSAGSRGDAWLFLYPPGQGFPLTQAFPEEVTAVSDVRLSSGDGRFTFARVPPNAYRLWGFLDTNGDFEPDIDVLGGPGAGDRVSDGVEVSVERGGTSEVDLALTRHLLHEPPAFVLDDPNAREVIELPAQLLGIHRLELRADALGLLDPRRTGFVVSLGDSDADGVADDGDGDGLPDLFPQLYLRFLRRPGQVVPLDSRGDPAEVILPLAFDPGPYLAVLAQDPSRQLITDRLTAFVLPQAQAITFEAQGRVVTPMDAVPVGDWELWAVSESGQFWRIPNDLGTDKAAHLGGRRASQDVRFRVVR